MKHNLIQTKYITKNTMIQLNTWCEAIDNAQNLNARLGIHFFREHDVFIWKNNLMEIM
jgi:hypothetical protein